MLSSVCLRRALCLPYRDSCREDANTATNNGSPNNELSKRERRATQNFSDHRETGCKEDAIIFLAMARGMKESSVLLPSSSTQNITNVHTAQSTKQGAQNESRNHNSLDRGIVTLHSASSGCGIDRGELLDPGV